MEKKQFKAESQRLMDLMINSIYTNRDIFLREIISNASDAIDKLAYRALTDDKVGLDRSQFKIKILPDKENGLLTVSDNGIGMNAEELENNLGTIASSGSLRFRKDLADAEEIEEKDVDIIGQFGVGFYSAFMVADKITVISRPYGDDKTYQWESAGVDGFTITEAPQRESVGTDVIMHIKDDKEEDSYHQFLECYYIKHLVKRYSDYIRYPIECLMDRTRSKAADTASETTDAPETDTASEAAPADDKKTEDQGWEEYKEWEVLNSMIPLWQRPKDEVTEDEYKEFYNQNFGDMSAPLTNIRVSVEGNVSYDALLFVPGAASQEFYTRESQRGLRLYSSGVMIMDRCEDLIPEHFRFVRGVVDTPDVALNISREMLQQTRVLQLISRNLEKKIKAELMRIQKDEREKYETFWNAFGLQIKVGIASGADRNILEDLLLFISSEKGKGTTLAEYVERMPEEQKYIYYACGQKTEQLAKLPQAERILDKGYEILYMTDDMDEFVVQLLVGYKEHLFKSINAEDAIPESEDEKARTEEKAQANSFVIDFVKETLGDKVADVRISKILKSQPVCMVADGAISLEMEKYFNRQGRGALGYKAQRVLELNADTETFAALKNAVIDDEDKAKLFVNLLYNQALIIAGLPLEDPAGFTGDICQLMK